MTEAAVSNEGPVGATSPPPQNVGEGYKKAAYEAEAPTAPPGLVPGMKFFLERFGHMMSRLVLTALYVVLIAPVGIIFRLVADPLMTRYPKAHSSFTRWTSKNTNLGEARRQG